MSGENWKRSYAMKIGKQGSKGFEIGNVGQNKDALHISFSIEKCDTETANNGKIQIWNLSDENLKLLDLKDLIVELRAGYGNTLNLVTVGNVTAVTTTMDKADRMTELEVVDGRVSFRDTYATISYNGVTNSKVIYNYIADLMGVAVVYGEGMAFKDIPNGFSYVGKADAALRKVSDLNGHSWSIQNGVLIITTANKPISAGGYLLSAETGLIDIPKRITIGSATSTDNAQVGYEVKYFMNGAIGVNDAVELRSKTASGYFRVYKVTFDGDNLEGDWICTAQLLEVKG